MKSASSTRHFWHSIPAALERRIGIRTVLAVAAFLRLASIFLLHSFTHPLTWEFGPLARSLVAGLGYTDLLSNGVRVPSIYMPPAYSYYLAFFYWVGGEKTATYLAVEVVNAAFGVMLVYIVYRIAMILSGESSALAAACITALFPSQVFMCNEFHGISIYIMLGAAAVFFLVHYLEVKRSWIDIIAAGLCMGVLILFRAEAPALALLYACILVWRGGRRAWAAVVVFVLLSAACVAPWTIRNYRQFHQFIPVCASGGLSLWVGNNPRATGSQHYSFFDPMSDDVKAIFAKYPKTREFQTGIDKALMHLAVQYMLAHPGHEAVLACKKLFLFFVFDRSHELGRRPVYWVPSILLTILGCWGAFLRGRKLFREDLLIVSSILFAVLLGMVVFVLPRYKMVIDPFIIIIASNVFAFGSTASQPEPVQELV